MQAISLDIPLIQQPVNTPFCGPACLAMLLAHHGINRTVEEITQEITMYDWGTTTPQLALYLEKTGFDTEIITMHPRLFHLGHRFTTRDEVLTHLQQLQPALEASELDAAALHWFISYVKAGGTITTKVPSFQDITRELHAGRPVISMLTHWFLFASQFEPRFTGHFNIITGINDTNILVNDPDWGTPFGGKHVHNKENYLYAIYASAYQSIDNACLLVARPRN